MDMSGLAHGRFRSVSEGASVDAESMATALIENRESLVRWVDQYINELYELRTMLASEDEKGLEHVLGEAHTARVEWTTPEGAEDAYLRSELRQAIGDSPPTKALMGTYLTEKIFRRKERGSR